MSPVNIKLTVVQPATIVEPKNTIDINYAINVTSTNLNQILR